MSENLPLYYVHISGRWFAEEDRLDDALLTALPVVFEA
jgi:hypothetical protein